MNLDDYRSVFMAADLVLILLAAVPTLSLTAPFPSGEPFSELWVLGPNHMIEEYPFNVQVNESYSVFVGVGNHLGRASYYVIHVKFRNQTQPLPNVTISEPSPLSGLLEYRFFVANGGTWETPISFGFLELSRQDDSLSVSRMSINEAVLNLNASTSWDSVYDGFFFQLFFELWLYDTRQESFEFQNRFAGIWLNMTA